MTDAVAMPGPVAAAVANREPAQVQTLLASGASANDVDDRGQPALVIATETSQFRLALLLIEHGADPWFVDGLGFTPAHFVFRSKVAPDSDEGRSRDTLIERFRVAGCPWPPPPRADVLAAKATGRWPPRLRPVG